MVTVKTTGKEKNTTAVFGTKSIRGKAKKKDTALTGMQEVILEIGESVYAELEQGTQLALEAYALDMFNCNALRYICTLVADFLYNDVAQDEIKDLTIEDIKERFI